MSEQLAKIAELLLFEQNPFHILGGIEIKQWLSSEIIISWITPLVLLKDLLYHDHKDKKQFQLIYDLDLPIFSRENQSLFFRVKNIKRNELGIYSYTVELGEDSFAMDSFNLKINIKK